MKDPATYKSYALGLLLSLLLTFAAYFVVVKKLASGSFLTVSLMVLALFQAVVQLSLFLHLDKEEKPRWNQTMFLFMAFVLVIIFFGSLWIMHNLDYQMMPPMHMTSAL